MNGTNSPDTHWPQRSYENRFGEPTSTEETHGLSDTEIDKRLDQWSTEQARIEEIAIKEFDAVKVVSDRHIRSEDKEKHASVTSMTIVLHDKSENQLSDGELRMAVDLFLQRLNEEKITYLDTFDYNGAELRTKTWDSFTIEVPDILDPR